MPQFILGCTGGDRCVTGFYREASDKGVDLKGHEGYTIHEKTGYDECWQLASLARTKYFSWSGEVTDPGFCKISTACSEPELSKTADYDVKLYECSGKAFYVKMILRSFQGHSLSPTKFLRNPDYKSYL